MKNTIAALIVGLFASAAFAQTPATAVAAPAAASTVPPAVAKAEAQHDKSATTEATKAEAKDASAAKPAKHAKHAKASNKHKTKVKTDAKDSQQSTVADAGATTSVAAK